MQSTRHWVLPLGLSLALLGALSLGASYGMAQDATPEAAAAPGRPAHIHAGACGEGELGDIVAPLNDLTAPGGEGVGQADPAVAAESSFTSVPLALDAILADDHAVNVHLSQEAIGTYLACGEVGGVVGEDGSLVIGLREVDGSGFAGIAFLAPGADGASTGVSVFIAEGLAGGAGTGAADDADDEEAEATPEA